MKRLLSFLLAFCFVIGLTTQADATVSTTTTRVKYTCNGTTTAYTYPFKILADAELVAVKADALGVETTFVLNTDYTVAGAGVDGGGTLTLTAGSKCPAGCTLTMLRNMTVTQETDYVDGDAFSAESLETALDKQTLIMQQQAEQIGRAPLLPKSSSVTNPVLPNPAANTVIGWNSAGTGLENKVTSTITALSTIATIGDYSDSLATAVSTIGITPKTVIIDKAITVSTDVTVPITLDLWFTREGSISIASGKTVTLHPPLAADHQLFTGAGSVAFTAGTGRWIHASWFGISPDATATVNTAAFGVMMGAYPSHSKVILPTGTIQINDLLTETLTSIEWESPAAHAWGTGGTTIQQTDLTKGILDVTEDFCKYKGICFDGNGTTADVVKLSASSGYHVLENCIVKGCSGDADHGALSVNSILCQVKNCIIGYSAGNGLYLGTTSNDFLMTGGAILTCATAGTAATAGVKNVGGYNNRLLGVAIESCGKAGATTTGGVAQYGGSLVVDHCSSETNINHDFDIQGGNDFTLLGGRFLGSAASFISWRGNVVGRITVKDPSTYGHSYTFSKTAAVYAVGGVDMSGFHYPSGGTKDAGFTDAKYFTSVAANEEGYGVRIEDYPHSIHSGRTVISLPFALWTPTTAGASVWEDSSTFLFQNANSIHMYKDGTNACSGAVAISAAQNTHMLNRWVTLYMEALTTDTTEDQEFYVTIDGGTTALTNQTCLAGQDNVPRRTAFSIYVDGATLDITLAAKDTEKHIYVGNIYLIDGIGP